MSKEFSDSELAAYLDEALSAEEMARVEGVLRDRPDLKDRLVGINRRRDSGVHSLGEIWRRNRVSCPPRGQLGSYVLGVLSQENAAYIEFHTTQIGCRLCLANLEDLKSRRDKAEGESAQKRRRKYFQTSAGLLSSPGEQQP